MKTKTIPFDLETAKKIQAGKIKGRILCKNGVRAKIVEFYMSGNSDIFVKRTNAESAIEWCYPYNEEGRFIDGKGYISTDYDLVLEVPDEPQKPQFKPFDKVLMRSPSSGYVCWYPHFYCRYIPDAKDKNLMCHWKDLGMNNASRMKVMSIF